LKTTRKRSLIFFFSERLSLTNSFMLAVSRISRILWTSGGASVFPSTF
jgi:hypothetical protein